MSTTRLTPRASLKAPSTDCSPATRSPCTVRPPTLATRRPSAAGRPAGSAWRLEELSDLADIGHYAASAKLAIMLRDRGDLDALRARAVAGDPFAAQLLPQLLAKHVDLDELRAWADAGDLFAAGGLVLGLYERGDEPELRARASACDEAASWWLASLLTERRDLDGLRALADAGNEKADLELAAATHRELDELRDMVDMSDWESACEEARLLAQSGILDELRARADAGNQRLPRN